MSKRNLQVEIKRQIHLCNTERWQQKEIEIRSRKKETEEELERNECPRVTCKQRLKTEGYRFTTVLMKMEEERDGENTDRTGMFKTKHRKTKN